MINKIRYVLHIQRHLNYKLEFLVTIQLRISLNIDLTVFCDEKCLVFPVQ